MADLGVVVFLILLLVVYYWVAKRKKNADLNEQVSSESGNTELDGKGS